MTLAHAAWALVAIGLALDGYNVLMQLMVWRSEGRAASAILVFPLLIGLIGVVMLPAGLPHQLAWALGLLLIHMAAAVLLPWLLRRHPRNS
jgi:hypothetical protein